MESLIFALLSLILLVPVLIILPLGLNARGKSTSIVASFLIAIIGILAKNAFLLWQSSLMVVLLAFLAAYILDKRWGSTIFVHITPVKKVAMEENKAIIESLSELEEAEQVVPDSISNSMVLSQNNRITVEKEESYVEKIEFENDDSFKEKVKTSKTGDLSLDEEIEEDISFVLDRDTLNQADAKINADEKSTYSQEMNYMEEIERMLETESGIEDVWIEGKKSQQQKSKLDIENKAENFSTALEESDQFDVKSKSNPFLEDDVELEEIHFKDSIKGARNQDKISSSHVMETTIVSTWEEDEIQPLHFDDLTNPLHITQKIKVDK